MKIKVLLENFWVNLILCALSWVVSILLLDVVFQKIGLISNNGVDGIIPFLIASIIFWVIGWWGLSYGKGPMKFLFK